MGFLGEGIHSNAVSKVAAYQIPLISNARMPLVRKRCGVLIKSAIKIPDYLKKKPNQNLLICGTTGQGKSKLMRLALEIMPNPKTIFSYKENDEYLQIEGNFIAAERSLPNPFNDPEAFTDAFAVAFNLQSEGIQASTAMSLVSSLAKESRTWADFISNAKKHAAKARDANVRSATNYLLEKIKALTYDSKQIELDLGKTNVLDMSLLNDDAKTFYSELFLRQIYAGLKRRRGADKVIVCVDEAHRLTRNVQSKRQSIINEMSREIRAFGMLWTATQNLSDIPDPLRNQFATQFLFSTTSEGDMRALGQIDRDLARCVSELRNHEFVDAKHEDVHKSIGIFRADISSLKERDLSSLRPAETVQAKPVTLEVPEGRPTTMLHAAMLAVYENPGAGLGKIAKYLKTKGWITSDPTIYGSKDRKGVLDNLVSLGYAKVDGSGYKLTEKALWWIDAEILVKRAKNVGSELHMQLMRKTVEKLHEENMLVVIPERKDVPDLIAYPMSKGNKKYLWDDKNRKAYEIQTTARKNNVLVNKKRNDRFKLSTTWIAHDEDMLEEIERLTEGKDKYMLIMV